jgi:hypothetical protein
MKIEEYEDGADSSYGYSGMDEALQELNSDGGWLRHCQMRAAIILTNNFMMDDGEADYVMNKYARTLESGLEGWEKMWHYGEDTEGFINERVEVWRKEYIEHE